MAPVFAPTSAPALPDIQDVIRVRGARVHNLRDLDADIPQGRLVVITGLSGSGKSSLAFDTLFAEGQRRYLESLSTYTRQFLDQLERPDVDSLEGLPPTLCIQQRAGTVQPRSTLATTTEIHDYLRVLYARAGLPHCPQCGRPISQQSPQAIVDQILALDEGCKVMLLAPLVRGRKGAHLEVFAKIAKDGFVRARVDGVIVDATEPPALKKGQKHDIEVVIDRIVVKPGVRPRLEESVAAALRLGEATCISSHQVGDGWEDRLFSSRFACPTCEISLAEIEPRTFSFNSPQGACSACTGLGTDESGQPCSACGGSRLGPVARSVTIAGRAIHEFSALSVDEAAGFMAELEATVDTSGVFTPAGQQVARRVLPDIASRLQYLRKVGLGYLTLDRPAASLSGGEFQRARLAGSLGSGLLGVCYILDEPTIGLHPRDADRLLQALFELRDQGNSVLVVEHDLDLVGQSDFVLDLGPGAGSEGGRLVAAGTPAEIAGNELSLTGRYLAGALTVAPPPAPRLVDLERALTIQGALLHNLQNLTVQVPLERLVCVTGVSGSGKSSLIIDTLVPLLREAIAGREPRSVTGQLTGHAGLTRLIEVDQSPIGKSGRSNPATYSGMWDVIRRIFSQTRESRARGYTSRRFSFNSAEGRCPACRGQGTRRIEMNFLPDLQVQCPACKGARFNPATLEIRYRGKSIADVLELRIDAAAEFFANFAPLARMLTTFTEVGLGYLCLGQSGATLSGGEAQRVKLATELGQNVQAGCLFVLDEPTTGLHPADIGHLLGILQRLVESGHSVVVIEHQLDIIGAADWVLDLGPEGGNAGGRLMAAGTPAMIAAVPACHTGMALRHRGSSQRKC